MNKNANNRNPNQSNAEKSLEQKIQSGSSTQIHIIYRYYVYLGEKVTKSSSTGVPPPKSRKLKEDEERIHKPSEL